MCVQAMIPRRLDWATPDAVWQAIREEAAQEAEREPILASFFHATILNHQSLEAALSFRLAERLGTARPSPPS